MSLFCIDGLPVLFDLINLDDAKRAVLTAMIKGEGGGVTNDENVIVKFTSKDAYERSVRPVRTKIYDVRLIEESIRQRRIIEPELYRLDEKVGDDDYHVRHLLFGKCTDSQCPTNSRCDIWQRDQDGFGVVYGAEKPSDDSETSMERDVFVENETLDESQPVLSAFLELEMSTSSPVESHDDTNVEQRIALKKKSKKAEKTFRKLPKFRKTRRAQTGDSSDSAGEETIPSVGRTNADASSFGESGIVSDGVSNDISARERDNSSDAGPSGVLTARKRHSKENGEWPGGENLVRNVAHHSFLARSSGGDDDVEAPKAKSKAAKKTSRGQQWRAKLKRPTDGQSTGIKSRRAFSPSERKIMLRYLIKNRYIHRAKGLIVWSQMIAEGYLTERTPQSLQNQFRKHVLPNIETMDYLEPAIKQKFLALRREKR